MAKKSSPESEKVLGTFIKVVSNLTSDHHGQVAGVFNAIVDYQRFDPSFSDEKALPHALRLLDWFYGPQNSAVTPAATTSVIRTKAKLKEDDLRQKAIQRMEPFVVRMRERVKEKGPDHVELAERLEKLGISEDTAGGNAAVSTSTAQTAKKRPREEEESESVDGDSDGQSEDDEDDDGHRKSKLRRITTSEDVERAAEKVWKSKSVKGILQHHFAEDRCDACKDNQNTICAIKPNSMSCIWCRVKKKKCVRNHARSTTSSKASGENLSSNAKSKGKERESHPQALHEKRAANENRSQDASSSDTDSAQQEEVIAEKRGNVHSHGHPRDATVMRNSLAAPTASAGATLQHDSWLITSTGHSPGSSGSSRLIMPPPKPPQAIQANNISAISRIPSSRAATPAPEISRLTTSYFQRTQRYVQMRARYADALADLLKAYNNLMSDVDKLTEAGLFPEVLNPDSWFKDETTALLIGSERYRREHPDQWEELVAGRNVPVAGSSLHL